MPLHVLHGTPCPLPQHNGSQETTHFRSHRGLVSTLLLEKRHLLVCYSLLQWGLLVSNNWALPTLTFQK